MSTTSFKHFLCKNEEGAAAIEFVIFAPLLAITALETAQLALRFNAQLSLSTTVRMGTEIAMRKGDRPETIVELLEANGIAAKLAAYEAESGTSVQTGQPEMTSANPDVTGVQSASRPKLELSIIPTDVCFTASGMVVAARDAGTCAEPERWIRIQGRYDHANLKGEPDTLHDHADIQIR